MLFVCHVQVHDTQHHEDVGLQGDDQDVEQCPNQGQQELRNGHDAATHTEQVSGAVIQSQYRNQDEDQFTRVHVTEQPQAQ